jgi:hypothetical protein
VKEDYARAIADETEAIRLDPNNADAYLYRGFTEAMGDLDNPLRHFDVCARRY